MISYYRQDAVVGTSQEQEKILSIAVSETVVFSSLKFLLPARDGVLWPDRDLDLRLTDNKDVRLSLPSQLPR